jgi:hypothetical protein
MSISLPGLPSFADRETSVFLNDIGLSSIYNVYYYDTIASVLPPDPFYRMNFGGQPANNLVARDSALTNGDDDLEFPIEVRQFCIRNQIEEEVDEVLRLVRHHFVMTYEPWLGVASDPEYDEQSLGIHIRVSGEIDEVVARWEAFLDAFVGSIDPNKQRHINVIYHPA